MNMTIVMIIVAVIFLALDLARMRNGFVMAIFRKLFNPLMRKHELEGKLTGATWVVLVSIPMIYFYPKNIAVLSLIFMSLGDGAAAIVGQAYGRIKTRFQKRLKVLLDVLQWEWLFHYFLTCYP